MVLGGLTRRTSFAHLTRARINAMGRSGEIARAASTYSGAFASFDPETNATMSRQKELAAVPLPSVKDTFERYVNTVKPYCKSDADFARVKAQAAAAIEDPDLAVRQAKLEELKASETSWIAKMINSVGYMQWQVPLPINSNVTGYMFDEYRKKWDPVFAAAGLTHGALKYHVALLNGKIAPNESRGKATCMDQYTRMFSLTRIPGETEDQQVKYTEAESKHIAVIANSHIYTVSVVGGESGREIIPLDLLHATFSAIKEDAARRGPAKDPVSVLTALSRPRWAAVRTKLVGGSNSKALNSVESAIFSVSLEQGVDATNEDCAVSCFVGDGKTTWFDKSFQIKVMADGNPSIHIEHSWADAPVPLDMFFNHALPYCESLDEQASIGAGSAALARARPKEWPEHSLIEWNLDAGLLADIQEADKAISAAKADSDVQMHRAPGVGTKVWKAAKVSPDAACQMAIQLAWRRVGLHGATGPVATYETIGMTSCNMGRTETCRVVSNESEAFIQNALSGFLTTRTEADRVEAEALLRTACAKHIAQLVAGPKGEGIDRHMFGLRCTSSDGSQPQVFTDPLFEESGGTGAFILSTSNNSYIPRGFNGLFGTVMPNGYGICYIPRADEVVMSIESKTSCPTTDSRKMCLEFERALHDVATMLGVASSSKL